MALAESAKDDAHMKRIGLGCPNYTLYNENIPRCCGLRSVQEHRGCSKEDYEHPAHLFNTTTALPSLSYASEMWALSKKEENAAGVIESSIKRTMLRVYHLT
ncbi:hypothetical protein RB195_023678 [Necator americanus]|uniref:Uncharacterized protein n=1 Tax=Necator americanus TaxID=51031 RepID=A0ABR1EKD5_NECAM